MGDIKPDKKLLYIPSGKGGSERFAPLPDGVIDYLNKIARLGGYLDRAKDLPPGNIIMWRGLSRLTDIALGATLKIDEVGN